MTKIRKCLLRWLFLSQVWNEGEDDDILQATIDLTRERSAMTSRSAAMTLTIPVSIGLEVHPDHAFSPPPKPLFRRVFVTMTKTYWLALLASLDAEQRDELCRRLDATPPYGRTIPVLPGRKCVHTPGDLSAKEIEGLMRTVVYVTAEMVPQEVTKSWSELAEVGVQLWEEDHELMKRR